MLVFFTKKKKKKHSKQLNNLPKPTRLVSSRCLGADNTSQVYLTVSPLHKLIRNSQKLCEIKTSNYFHLRNEEIEALRCLGFVCVVVFVFKPKLTEALAFIYNSDAGAIKETDQGNPTQSP